MSAFLAELNMLIAVSTPEAVLDCLDAGSGGIRCQQIPSLWGEGEPSDSAARQANKSELLTWAHRDLDKIANDQVPAAWYGAAASSASTTLSRVASTADQISAATSSVAAALWTLQRQVDDARAKDDIGVTEMAAARDGIKVVMQNVAVADRHSAQFLDADAQLQPWYQMAQQAAQTRLDAANQAATAAAVAGLVFDQQEAALRTTDFFRTGPGL